jgi:hypothetical protein
VGLVLLAVLVVMQFMPQPRTNPPVTREVRWDGPATRALAQRATFGDVEDNVTRGEMPIWNYVILHPEAKLTPAETKQLLDGLRATFLQDPPIARRR